MAIWTKVLAGQYDPLPPDIPMSVVMLVDALLEEDPNRRISSAADLLDCLTLLILGRRFRSGRSQIDKRAS
jgi:hypothetical protein